MALIYSVLNPYFFDEASGMLDPALKECRAQHPRREMGPYTVESLYSYSCTAKKPDGVPRAEFTEYVMIRANCILSGQRGHLLCGLCSFHHTPQIMCHCRVKDE